MNPLLLQFSGFLICAAFIVFGGARLSYYGDQIATITGMGKAWLGLVLMASITSLPELITGISAILVVHAPDIAVGDVMGSCVFNLLILAVLDALTPGAPVYSRAGPRHLPATLLGILLLATAATALSFHRFFPVIGWVSSASVVLLLLYFAAVRLLFVHEQKNASLVPQVVAEPQKDTPISLRKAMSRYALYALLVVAVALALPYFAENLAVGLGLQRSFVGTLMVATATSLPELTVSVAALRLGSADMAIGNLLGSNLFNMLILVTDDVMYTSGPLFAQVAPIHALSAMAAILMTTVAGLGLLAGNTHKNMRMTPVSVVLSAIYLMLVLILWNNQ